MWNVTHTKTYNLDGPNNNKMLIYNLLCCFLTRVIYARVFHYVCKGGKTYKKEFEELNYKYS